MWCLWCNELQQSPLHTPRLLDEWVFLEFPMMGAIHRQKPPPGITSCAFVKQSSQYVRVRCDCTRTRTRTRTAWWGDGRIVVEQRQVRMCVLVEDVLRKGHRWYVGVCALLLDASLTTVVCNLVEHPLVTFEAAHVAQEGG